MADTHPLVPQDALLGGKYRLGPVIGSGGVATVYRATHVWTEREVAVKLLDPTLPHFKRLREGFLREARATVQLQHPNVVDVLDMGEDRWEIAYLVMELLEGPTLRDVLLEHGHLDPEETLSILLPLIDALEKAHELGIVHRDFKPENIMLTRDTYGVVTPKLLDFGVAEILQDLRSRKSVDSNEVIMGTPQYMAPEQAQDQRALIGPQTDVWGVGVVWYECVTGRSPFDGDSATEILQAVCESEIDFDGVPEVYAPILRDALTRPPTERLDSFSTLKTRIEEIGFAIASAPPPPPTLSSWPLATTHTQRSSWPLATTDAQSGLATLTGLGPEGWVSPIPLARRSPIPLTRRSSSPLARRIDTERLRAPVNKRDRRGALGGIALTIVISLAAWWTVRDPGPPEEIEFELPAVVIEPAPVPVPVRTEPVKTPSEPLPTTEAPSSIEETAAEPESTQDAVPAAAPAKPPELASPQSPPKRRRKPRARPRPPKPAAGSAYEGPPGLVTEW